jgi:hypothetical protein
MGQADALYLGQLKELPRPASSSIPLVLDDLRPGSDYPLNLAHGKTYSVLQRDERLIAKKQGGRITFVRSLDKKRIQQSVLAWKIFRGRCEAFIKAGVK